MDVTVTRTTGTYEALFLEYPLDFLVGGSLVHAEDLVRGLLGHGLDLLLGLLRPQGRHGRGREQARQQERVARESLHLGVSTSSSTRLVTPAWTHNGRRADPRLPPRPQK